MNKALCDEIAQMDATAQSEEVRTGRLSRQELLQCSLSQIASRDCDINAVTWVAEDFPDLPLALPLGGAPWLLKASLEMPGWPFTSCSRSQMNRKGKFAWPFVNACLAAGLVPIGLSAMPEFGLLTTGEPLATGPVQNPEALGRSAGGSSSGAAASVAAGYVALAHASDAAGSIRIPASNCGVIGMKPSRGGNLRARAPHIIDDVLCSDMLIARSMRDIEAAYGIVGSSYEAPRKHMAGLRVGLVSNGLNNQSANPVVLEKVEQAASALASAGAIVEPVGLPCEGESVIAAFQAIWMYEGAEILAAVTAINNNADVSILLEPWTIGLAEAFQNINPNQVAEAWRQVGLTELSSRKFFEHFDVLLSPVSPEPPIELGRHAPDRVFSELWDDFWSFVNFTPHANIAGLPSITLPFWGASDIGPIGVMMTMAQGQDRTLTALARELEGTVF